MVVVLTKEGNTGGIANLKVKIMSFSGYVEFEWPMRHSSKRVPCGKWKFGTNTQKAGLEWSFGSVGLQEMSKSWNG